MNRMKRLSQAALIAFLLILLNGCLAVRVMKNVRNPSRHFEEAYKRIERIHRTDPDREGPARRVNGLIYDRSSRKLVKIIAPFWLVEIGSDADDWVSDEREEYEFARKYDMDWSGLEGLNRIGPGLVVDIDDEGNRILIWVD